MKKFKRWLTDIFEAGDDIDLAQIGEALNDPSVRVIWIASCLSEIKRIHMEIDRRVLGGNNLDIKDLCARRKAYQDVMEAVLSARRTVTQDVRHNPRTETVVNLDRVTA